MLYNSDIFESLVKDYNNQNSCNLDITENVQVDFSEESLNNAKCSIAAYGLDQLKENFCYNIEKNPEKAAVLTLEFPDQKKCEIFLETKTKEWSSKINGNSETILSPEQMERFFKSKLFHNIQERLYSIWDVKNQEPYIGLKDCLKNKRYKTEFEDIYRNEENDGMLNEIETRRHKVKLGIPNEKDENGNKIRSSSGRKLIHFNDMGVSKGEDAYYSWPGGLDDKHVFKWSRWNNWENQRPFIRARIPYSIDNFVDIISLSLSPFAEDDKNRGFKVANISLLPPVQYLSPEEAQDVMNLSIVRRFMKTCYERISHVLSIPDEEIFKKINRPDKCTLEDIRKTKRVFRNSLKAVRESRADTYIYT